MRFNKAHLIAEMQSRGMTKGEATKAVDYTLAGITNLLRAGGDKSGTLVLRDFGTFRVSNHPGRTARNPRTGKPMFIEASRGVRFKAAKALKEEVN